MPSSTGDSHRFLKDAAEKGAVAAIVHSDEGYELALSLGLAVAQLDPDTEPPNPRTTEPSTFQDAIWRIALAAFGDPGLRMKLIGITGTNGKTTTAWIVRDLLNALGVACGYLGTLGFQTPAFERELANTTPFPIELYAMLHEAADSGCKAMAIEVSSHALAQHRADGISFEVVAFTNLSQDHLDFHGTMADYEAAKLRLFTEFDSQVQVINTGDKAGQRFVAASECPRTFEVVRPEITPGKDDEGLGVALPPVTDSESVPNSLFATPRKVELTKLQVAIEGTQFEANLGGDYNVENCVAAYAVVRALSIPEKVENAPRHDASGAPRLVSTSRGAGDESCTGFEAQGFSPERVSQAMAHVRPVPGRFEPVRNERNIGIIVDYAHTPDALTKLLQTARPLVSGRIITVFGCGGDRDKSKRPLMAAAASKGSDYVIATSDNPRTEDPLLILKEIEQGLTGLHETIPDRPQAIARAIELAKEGDAVIIAGKGHENYQIMGREKFPMDDRELAKKGLEAKR